MARVTVEDCLPLVDNRFALVLLATKRTRQLMAGARKFSLQHVTRDDIAALTRDAGADRDHPARGPVLARSDVERLQIDRAVARRADPAHVTIAAP